MKKIDVSIIIVSWNVAALLKKCIMSIIHNTKTLYYEIIIVDNKSEDETQKIIRNLSDRFDNTEIRFIQNNVNLGFSIANNIGFKIARGEAVLFLNPDTELKENAIEKSYNYLRNNEGYGAIGCKIVYPDGSIYHPCARGFPTPSRVFYQMFMLPKIFPKNQIFGAINLEFWDKNISRDVDCLVGAFIMAKTQILRKIEPFREEYFMYGEDIDLCYRIKEEGWNIRYFADTCIIHHTEKSSQQVKINNFKTIMMAESGWLFHTLNYGPIFGFLFRTVILGGSIFRLIVGFGMANYFIITFNRNKYNLTKNLLIKYIKLAKWSIGLENWVKKYNNKIRKPADL